ncbi:DNA-binding transcriptional activator MhpR, partial [Acidovorax delafieldii 2AN]
VIEETRFRGYGFNDGEWHSQAHIGAVAVPILSRDNLLGVLNLIFPKSAMSPSDLTGRFVPLLEQLAQRIGKDARAWI